MTNDETRPDLLSGARLTTALQGIIEASDGVVAAKRTHSATLIEQAQKELQAAVDGARDQRAQWGQIGSVLGIARGNAYQRYRKRLPGKRFEVSRGAVVGYR